MLKPRPPFVAFALLPFLLGSIQDDPGLRPAAPPEEAYRANNRGVGFLEQYSFLEAVAELQKAVALAPGYAQARINLAIAQFHAPDLAASSDSQVNLNLAR